MASRGVLASIGAGIGMAALAGLFSLTPIAHRLENQYALGSLFGLRGPVRPPEGAVVVAIDRQTVAWLRDLPNEPDGAALLSCIPEEARRGLAQIRGPGSIPRSVHACLLSELGALGFPVVGYDILFAVAGETEDDERLAQAMRDHGAVAILIGMERSTVSDGGSELLVEREMLPLALFRASASAAGTFVVPRSGGPVYGYLRAVPGFEATPPLPGVALQLLPSDLAPTGPPRDRPAFEYLWLYGPPGTIRTISARDLLSGGADESLRAAASRSAAFIGASDPNTTDYVDSFPSFFRSGIGADISGVELVATAFLNARSGQLVETLPPPIGWLSTVLFAFALGLLARARSGYAMLAAPVAGILVLGVGAYAFSRHRLFLPIGTPVFAVAPAAFLLAVVIRYRFARALIMRLAPAPIARQMLLKATEQRGDAVEHEATIAFFDLIGSTAIAERLAAVDFNALLNSYFDTVSECVERERGMITAFAGDGITAVFLASRPRDDHALRACRAVSTVVGTIGRANEENAVRGLPSLHLRVGLNSGLVAEGEIGARDRFNFSVVGDAVNLAARLEQLGKTLFPEEKDVVLAGSATFEAAAPAGLDFRDCGVREIRGRERPEHVYRLALG